MVKCFSKDRKYYRGEGGGINKTKTNNSNKKIRMHDKALEIHWSVS